MNKFFLLLLFFGALKLWGANGAGNSAGAWVCFDLNREIRWVSLIDFYEARKEFKLELEAYSGKKYPKILKAVLAKTSRIDKLFANNVSLALKHVLKNRLPSGSRLKKLADSHYRIIPNPKECRGGRIRYAQLANFAPYNKLLIDMKYFNYLSELDKAGLMIHEAVYKHLRDTDRDKGSVRTREIVGYLFSNLKDEKVRSLLTRVLGRTTAFKVVLPNSKKIGQLWSYTFTKPTGRWQNPSYDDSKWENGFGAFGFAAPLNEFVRTPWRGDASGGHKDIWLRKDFNPGLLSTRELNNLRLDMIHDEDVSVYLNGILATKQTGFLTRYKTFAISWEAKASLKMNKINTISVHCRNRVFAQGVDVGLVVKTQRN